jgi:osmoprotectant transport system ATP-binding protein
MIQLQGVTKRYGDRTALHPTDLTVPEGEVTALIGPSGCGKSTLIRTVLGLIEPDGGKVSVAGSEVMPATAQEVRRKVGYVIQDGGLFPHLTARENVTLMANHLGMADAEKRMTELVDLTRLPADALDRYPVELSGGQRQRVGLMRALMLRPKVLLLDEPLGALDPLVRAALQADLKRVFGEDGLTVLFVTHDMGEAAFLGDRIVLLRDGKIVQQGALDDFRTRPADPFVTEFMNAQRPAVAI